MKNKEAKKKIEELKDRKIDEEVLEDVAGGRGIDINSSSNSFMPTDDAKGYPGGLGKKKH